MNASEFGSHQVKLRRRADRISAWAVGTGIGLIVLMLTWTIGNRLTAMVWEPPLGPTVAFVSSIAAGLITSIVMGIRLDRSQRSGYAP